MEKELALLRQPRLAALATSAWPAWLWTTDGTHIIWANAAGAAIFGAATATECAQHRFDPGDASAAQIVRLAAVLPAAAQERLERLRGFGASFGRALTCACSRIVLDGGKPAVLIAAVEPAGPSLTLGERVRRLFADGDAPIAAFVPDGSLVYASAAAEKRLAGATRLSALGIETLAATVFETGSAGGTACLGGTPVEVAALRLGKDASRVVLLTMPQHAGETATEQTVSQVTAAPAVESEAPQTPATPPQPDAQAAEPAAAAAVTPHAEAERRHPLRFVWHMDADGRFGVGSDEFIELAGPQTAAAFGRPWTEIAAAFQLDPNNQVARAVASHETWSGIVVSWPVDDSSERLPVELSGLPVFDRDRNFRGYRGFGVCRDIDRINHLARRRREHPIGFMAAPEAQAKPAAPAAEPIPAAMAAAERPALSIAPASANVVPFRPSPPPEPKVPSVLSPVERRAFRELAQELTARLRGPEGAPLALQADAENAPDAPAEVAALAATAAEPPIVQVLLDRIPVGVLVYRHDKVLYANRHFLEWSGYQDLAAIETAGGLGALFAEPAANAVGEADDGLAPPVKCLSIVTPRRGRIAVEGRMFTVPWAGASALALILTNGQKDASAHDAEKKSDDLKTILGTITDGTLTLDRDGRVIEANDGADALLGAGAKELAGQPLFDLLTPESKTTARDYFERILHGMTILNKPVDVAAHRDADRPMPLAMTLVRVGDDRVCAVFRDMTELKRSEEELRSAKREAARATSAKAEFLAKVSHEIRTPLNTITGFAEVIAAERFGPIGNERYREYVKDIHAAGMNLVSMLNDLVDLSRVETGQADLAFANLNLNELTQQCVGIMQPQANRARIIIRTSLTPGLPLVVADERALRQIVLGLISNSIKSTGPGGQVIVSTVFTDDREAVLRVRDTGAGMSEKDIEAALAPFRDGAAAASSDSGGPGFSLPLTKALAEANRARFDIQSAPNAGTLVEIAFPPSRIVAA